MLHVNLIYIDSLYLRTLNHGFINGFHDEVVYNTGNWIYCKMNI